MSDKRSDRMAAGFAEKPAEKDEKPAAKDEPATRATLPLGELPHITDTDPPPLHPDTITGPPAVIDVPHLSQEGATLSCTMGNWTNLPTSYAYQFQLNGEDVGANAATYDVDLAADEGKTAVCIVTATNGLGSSEAPPSNEVVVTATATRRHENERHGHERHGHHDEPDHKGHQEPAGHR
jgi:hypothetical protein